MKIKCFDTGILGSNSYIVWSGTEGVIIDAGVSDEEIMKYVNENNITIKYIILTHGHIDHICYSDSLRGQTGAKVVIHKNDNKLLSNPGLNGSRLFARDMVYGEADETVEDGEIITAGDLKFEVLHTPGHSSGSMCLKIEDKLFSGDTLFYLAYGRTDLPGGNQNELDNSFRSKLLKLDDNVEVYSGHGNSTTIGFERKNNSYIKYL
jgi:glyoxylase-like metal-dependent hydrolase (beta-lactamase superfamily II)